MSWEAVQWAMDKAPMLRTPAGKPDTTARSVLIARAERADKNGRDSHAAIVEIIWRTGFDKRTIDRAEDRLEAAGLMVRDGHTGSGTVRWHLDMTKVRDEAELDEIRADIERQRADNAKRERERRARRGAVPRVDSAPTRPRGDLNATRADSTSTRVDAEPPEPPLNHPVTPQGTELNWRTADAARAQTNEPTPTPVNQPGSNTTT